MFDSELITTAVLTNAYYMSGTVLRTLTGFICILQIRKLGHREIKVTCSKL